MTTSALPISPVLSNTSHMPKGRKRRRVQSARAHGLARHVWGLALVVKPPDDPSAATTSPDAADAAAPTEENEANKTEPPEPCTWWKINDTTSHHFPPVSALRRPPRSARHPVSPTPPLPRLWGLSEPGQELAPPDPHSWAYAVLKLEEADKETAAGDGSMSDGSDADNESTKATPSKPKDSKAKGGAGKREGEGSRQIRTRRALQSHSSLIEARLKIRPRRACHTAQARLNMSSGHGRMSTVLTALLRSPGTAYEGLPLADPGQVLSDVWVLDSYVCLNRGQTVCSLDGKHRFGLLDRGRQNTRIVCLVEHSPPAADDREHVLVFVTEEGTIKSMKPAEDDIRIKNRRLPQTAVVKSMYMYNETMVVVKSKIGTTSTWLLTVVEAESLMLVYQVRLQPKHFGSDLQDVDLQNGCLWTHMGGDELRCYSFEQLISQYCSVTRKKDEIAGKMTDMGDTHTVSSRPKPLFEMEKCYGSMGVGSRSLAVLPRFLLKWSYDRDDQRNGVVLVSSETGRKVGMVSLEEPEDEDDELAKRKLNEAVTFVGMKESAGGIVEGPVRLLCVRPDSVSLYTVVPEGFSRLRGNRFKDDDGDGGAPEPLIKPVCCTHEEGYKTQNIHICQTCIQETGHVFGICSTCRTHCHDGHETIDIGTRHNFRCDCGTPKMSGRCVLVDGAKEKNKKNKYNHNFQLRYCVCDGQDSGGIMVQCVQCDEWLHGECAGISGEEDVLDMEGSVDFICSTCLTGTIKAKLHESDIKLQVKLGAFVVVASLSSSKSRRSSSEPKSLPPSQQGSPASGPASRPSSPSAEDSKPLSTRSRRAVAKTRQAAVAIVEEDVADAGTSGRPLVPDCVLEEDLRIDGSDASGPIVFTAPGGDRGGSSGGGLRNARHANRRVVKRELYVSDSSAFGDGEIVMVMGERGGGSGEGDAGGRILTAAYDEVGGVLAVMVAGGGGIYMYDHCTGALLRRVRTAPSWSDDWEHKLHLQNNVIVHTALNASRQRTFLMTYHLSAAEL